MSKEARDKALQEAMFGNKQPSPISVLPEM